MNRVYTVNSVYKADPGVQQGGGFILKLTVPFDERFGSSIE